MTHLSIAAALPIVPILLLPFILIFFIVVFPLWLVAVAVLWLLRAVTAGRIERVNRWFQWVLTFGGIAAKSP